MRNINYTANTFDIYIDDVLKSTDADFWDGTKDVGHIHLRHNTDGNMTIDNITIGTPYSAPAPGTEEFNAIFFGVNF